MQYRTLGATGLAVSVIGLGCSHLGLHWRGKTRADLARLLDHALTHGITFFDTADVYMQGESEALLGEMLAPRRQQIVIATKVGFRKPINESLVAWVRPYVWSLMHRVPAVARAVTKTRRRLMRQDFSADYLRSAVEASLKRLRTDRIDLLQLHSPPASAIERGGALDTLERLRSEGKIRFYGLSYGTWHEARVGPPESALSTLQLPISVGAMAVDALSAARESSLGVIANQPLQKGTLLHGGAAARLAHKEGSNTRSLAQRVIRYVADVPGVSTVLTGTTSMTHLDENVAALDGPPLSDEELVWLKRDGLPASASAPL